MKNLMTKFFLFLTVAIAAIGFTACSDDDDTNTTDSIVGTWVAEQYADGGYISLTFTFLSNGSGKVVMTMKEGSTSITEEETFQYTYEDGVLYMNYDEGGVDVYYVTKTGNTLMLNDGESLLTLKKK